MSVYEQVAMGEYLNYWPDHIEFNTLISLLNDDCFEFNHEPIEPVEHFAGYPGEFLASCIDSLKDVLERTFEIRHESD